MMRVVKLLTVLFFFIVLAGFIFYQVKNTKVEDIVPPVITADSDTITVKVGATDEELLAGMTAVDDRDGDVTDSLVVVSRSKFSEKGKCRVSYAAFDAESNVATYSRILTYSDYRSPRFEATEPFRCIAAGTYSVLDKIAANDCLDGDLTRMIKFQYSNDDWYYGEPGEMGMIFQVTNSAGDTTQLEVDVECMEDDDFRTPCPKLTDYIVYTKKGYKVDFSKYIDGVLLGNSEYLFKDLEGRDSDTFAAQTYRRGNISFSGDVNFNEPGVYKVKYLLKTPSREDEWKLEEQGTTTLYLVVR